MGTALAVYPASWLCSPLEFTGDFRWLEASHLGLWSGLMKLIRVNGWGYWCNEWGGGCVCDMEEHQSCDTSITSEQHKPSYSSCGVKTIPGPLVLLSIKKICDNDPKIALMTGLESYRKFWFVLQTLGPAAYQLNYRWSQSDNVSVENQFLITLIKLQRNYSTRELAMFFSVSTKTVFYISCIL